MESLEKLLTQETNKRQIAEFTEQVREMPTAVGKDMLIKFYSRALEHDQQILKLSVDLTNMENTYKKLVAESWGIPEQ